MRKQKLAKRQYRAIADIILLQMEKAKDFVADDSKVMCKMLDAYACQHGIKEVANELADYFEESNPLIFDRDKFLKNCGVK